MRRREANSDEHDLVRQVRMTIAEQSLILPNDLVLVAVSGGPDSTALLLCLKQLGYSVHAAHLNHGLRAEAAAEADFVDRLCRERNIPVILGDIDVAGARKASGGGIQEVARNLRYEFLQRTADAVGAGVIATAHTSDDRVETVLLNIIRGTGTDGLRGIPYRRDRIVRPLLDVSRAEVEDFCAAQNIDPCRDASNDGVAYARNRVRNELIPFLEERFDAKVRGAILRLSEIQSDECEYLDNLASEWMGTVPVLDSVALSTLPAAMQRRILRRWLGRVANLNDVEMAHIESMRAGLTRPFAVTLPGAVRIVGDGRWIARKWLEEKTALTGSQRAEGIPIPGHIEFDGWLVTTTGYLPVGVKPIIRTLLCGDRMRFSYGRKKLSDLFRETKLALPVRWTVPLLVDAESGEVIAIANLRVSDAAPGLGFTAVRIGA